MTFNPLRWGLIPQIMAGVCFGALVGLLLPGFGESVGLAGELFVSMLKAVAPLLVMLLVMSAISNRNESGSDGRKTFLTLLLYLTGTVSAALVALTLFALVAGSLYQWLDRSLAGAARAEAHAQRLVHARNVLAWAEELNPMAQPQGRAELGDLVIEWQSEPLTEVLDGAGQGHGISLFQTALYRLDLRARHGDISVDLQVFKTGFEQIRFPENDA